MNKINDISRGIDLKTKLLYRFLNNLSEYLGFSNLCSYFDEINSRSEIIIELENSVKEEACFETKRFKDIFELRLFRIINYVIIRGLKPAISVETGVLHGLTSHFLLCAILRNGYGHLISIDLPSYHDKGPANSDGFIATLPPKREPGWVVPERYKRFWTLHLGRSIEKLPEVFSKNQTIDMFLHDSEHTYETMFAEMTLAWDHLRDGGVLVCDNIDCNTAFFDFCRKIAKIPFICPHEIKEDMNSPIRFGIIKR